MLITTVFQSLKRFFSTANGLAGIPTVRKGGEQCPQVWQTLLESMTALPTPERRLRVCGGI